jgi:nucleoside-diphosphate-sugar epimerase
MVRCLVTGAAGFIGSHLCEQLLREGHQVIGLDAFIPYYSRSIKESYIAPAKESANFIFHELDLRYDALQPVLEGVEVVFHLAAMPGLVRSWSDFDLYMSCNLQGTQRLLEAARSSDVRHFIYGSTSSVYGKFATGNETSPLAPISPYGVTKLSSEHLCQAYARTYALPLTILRFFSVYGPRQRPDMAYHKFIQALLQDQPITVYGDGEQSRSNTYIADCIRGVLLAFEKRDVSIGETFNLGGGEVVTVNQALAVLAGLTERPLRASFVQAQTGDQRHTAADFSKAKRLLGYVPTTSVTAGLYAQLAWQRELLKCSV